MQYFLIETMPFGENCYILYDEISKQCAVIDPGGDFKKITDFIDKKNLSPKYVLLTHSHADHIAVLQEVLDKYPDIQLIASHAEKKLLKNPIYNLAARFSLKYTEFDAHIYVDESSFINLGEHKISFILTPGHTAGSMCILAENLLFTGDTLFAGSIGRSDLPTGSYFEIEKSLIKLSKMDDNLLILPGHGESSTIGYEKKYNPFMRGI